LSCPLRRRPKRLRLLAVPALRSNYQAQGGQTADRLWARAKPTLSPFSYDCSAFAVVKAQRACELLLTEADVGELTKAVELALFYDSKLDLTVKG
jgi:hypothetical protein